MIERTFFAIVLVACAAAAALSLAEPAKVAATHTPEAPVIQLERVVITAMREDVRQVATATDATASRPVQ